MKEQLKTVFLYVICVYLSTSALVVLINFLSVFTATNSATPLTAMLFICCNLMPVVFAYVFAKKEKRVNGLQDFFKQIFLTKEHPAVFIIAVVFLFCYFGISFLLGNTIYHATILQCFIYFPQAIFLGGLEEVGWRWYLQPTMLKKDKHLNVIMIFIIISIIWAGWHIPIYQVAWVQQASNKWFMFYLLILGNTFTLGTLRLRSKGAWVCIIYHALLDSLSGMFFVQSKSFPVICMVAVECIVSVFFIMKYDNVNIPKIVKR